MKDFEDTRREGTEDRMSDQHKPLTAAEIEELRQVCANYANPNCGATGDEVHMAFGCIPRLLSMLTPPTDAALREAVER